MSGFFFALAASIACLSAAIGLFAAARAVKVSASLRHKQRSLELQMQSQQQLAEEMQSALTDVTNRVKMMRVRNAANHVGNGKADPYSNPDAWRREMNKTLALRGAK